MKRVLTLIVAAMMGMATASAQSLLAEPENTTTNDPQMFTEQVEEKPASVSFEAVKDASFPTENDMSAEVFELSENPDKLTAGLLAILLGDIGVQHFYTGQALRGVLDILFCWTGVPAIIGLIEGIVWLCDDDEGWAERVAKWNSR
ncbi:MAG: TM2 domain-containing protein [Bacteroidales bacterium]|nr:TM2 domain-containing protein [Bacteroidales bacterium]